VGDVALYLDTYTSHQFVKTFADLPEYIGHFTAGTSTVLAYESATTTGGVSYLTVRQDNGMCGMMTVTAEEYILHLFTSCSTYEKAHPMFDTLKLIPAVSVH
jgi:hypothetical protein